MIVVHVLVVLAVLGNLNVLQTATLTVATYKPLTPSSLTVLAQAAGGHAHLESLDFPRLHALLLLPAAVPALLAPAAGVSFITSKLVR
jgi:hypothetical protein